MYSTIDKYLGNIDSELENKDNSIQLNWKNEHVMSTANPKICGPPYWFTLHISAAYYPYVANDIVKEKIKNKILAIPYDLPCPDCRTHALAFIEEQRENLDKIVYGRHSLGKFYVDLHNYVNRRYGKKEWVYEEAYKMYSGNSQLTYLSGY